MTDSELISNLTGDSNVLMEFSERQWVWLPDNNQGSYTSGRLEFDTTSMKNSWILWNTAFIQVPIRIVSGTGTNAYTAATRVALRNSVASLIWGMVVFCNDTKVTQPQYVGLMSQIRRLVDCS